MAKKYYAVANGKEGSGIYQTWDQAHENISGISGVRFKAFPSVGQARQFLKEQGIPEDQIRAFGVSAPAEQRVNEASEAKGPDMPWPPSDHRTKAPEGNVRMEAYVDGSFRQGYDVYGYGVVIVEGGEAVHTLSGTGSRAEYVTMRNVAGEVLGAVRAMQYALEAGAGELVVYFDYQGIESWATGAWKRNNDLTRGYHDFVRSLNGRLKVTFQKVRGHSGDRFNDMADELAKEAVTESGRLKANFPQSE